MTQFVLYSLTITWFLAQVTKAQTEINLDHDAEAEAYWSQVNPEVSTSRLTISLQSDFLDDDCLENSEHLTHRLKNLFYRILEHTVLHQALISVECIQTVHRQTGAQQIVNVGLDAITYLNYEGSVDPNEIQNLQRLFDDSMDRLHIQYRVLGTQIPAQYSSFLTMISDTQSSAFWQSVNYMVPTTTVIIALSHDYFRSHCRLLNRRVRELMFRALQHSDILQMLVNVKCMHTIVTAGRRWHFVRVGLDAERFHYSPPPRSVSVEDRLERTIQPYLIRENFTFSVLGVHNATKAGWYSLTFEFPWIEGCNSAIRPIQSDLLNTVNFQSHFRTEIDGLRSRLTQLTESSANVEEITVLGIKFNGAKPRVMIAANVRFTSDLPQGLARNLLMAVRNERMTCQRPVKQPLMMKVIRGKWQPDLTYPYRFDANS